MQTIEQQEAALAKAIEHVNNVLHAKAHKAAQEAYKATMAKAQEAANRAYEATYKAFKTKALAGLHGHPQSGKFVVVK